MIILLNIQLLELVITLINMYYYCYKNNIKKYEYIT